MDSRHAPSSHALSIRFEPLESGRVYSGTVR